VKQLSSIFNVVEESAGFTICEYLGTVDPLTLVRSMHRFAIHWDSDRDERVVTIIEEWIVNGFMDHVSIIGETKAFLSVVTNDFGNESDDQPYLFSKKYGYKHESVDFVQIPEGVNVPCIGGEDYWTVEHVRMCSETQYVNDEKKIKDLYRGMIAVFCLGPRGTFVPARR